jgi:hypothetical protein
MNQRTRAMIVACLLLAATLLAAQPTTAQGDPGACPALVELALQSVREVCDRLGRDEACYGHTHVEATFWEDSPDLAFSAPADRVPLLDLRTLATAPLDLATEEWGVAVLSLRASMEGTLPGQAVTFLLMGDAQLENAVTPEDASADLAPMQAFYFTAGLSAPACAEAPDALFVQSPQGVEVALRINDLDMTIGSSIIVSLTTIPDGAGGEIPVMVVTLLQGTANVLFNDQRIAFEQPDWTGAAALPVYAVTLNAEGRVDANSVAVEPPLDAIAPVVQASCANAMIMLERPQTLCSVRWPRPRSRPRRSRRPAAPIRWPGSAPAIRAAAAPGSTINQRGGPGTNYPLQGQLTALQAVRWRVTPTARMATAGTRRGRFLAARRPGAHGGQLRRPGASADAPAARPGSGSVWRRPGHPRRPDVAPDGLHLQRRRHRQPGQFRLGRGLFRYRRERPTPIPIRPLSSSMWTARRWT